MLVEQFHTEFTNEFKGTRRVLDNVDFDKFDYKPHPKSFSFGHLTAHLANMPWWGLATLTANEYHLTEADTNLDKSVPATKEEMMAKFDENVAKFLETLKTMTEDQMHETWTMYFQGKPYFGIPRHVALRSSVMNHMIHHRAQLTVYLRMNDLRVPGLYGPSADDQKK